MHERETDVVAHRVKTPDFVHGNLVFLTKAPGDIDHRRGDIQVKRGMSSGELGPFGECFKVIDGFACFDFDNGLEAPVAIGRIQHEIGIQSRGAGADRDVLLGTRIDPGIVLTPVFHLQQPDDTVVLELFADRPHQDRAHLAPPNCWINAVVNP
jgi:hypothetical protein